jgi:hypothetical protein
MSGGMRHKAILLLECALGAVILVACGSTPESAPAIVSTPTPTPDIEATVEARLNEERTAEATIEAKAQAMAKAMVEATAQTVSTAPTNQPSRPFRDEPKYPRIDSRLNKLVGQIGSRSTADIAGSAPVSIGDLVAVTVRLSHNLSNTVDFLKSAGAIVANISTDYIEVYTPVTVLVPLAEKDGVLKVEAIIPPEPAVTD